MQKFNDQATTSAQALTKAGDESRQRERFLKEENTKLRMRLARFEQKEKSENGIAPHQLPEMTASWTRRVPTSGQQDSTPSPSRASGQNTDQQSPTAKDSSGGAPSGKR